MNNDLLAFAEFAKDNDHIGRIKVNDQSLSAREFEVFKAGARHGRAMVAPSDRQAEVSDGVAMLIVSASVFCKIYKSNTGFKSIIETQVYHDMRDALAKIK